MDITIKDLPDGMDEAKLKEHVSMFVEVFERSQKENSAEEVSRRQAATEQVAKDVDSFRISNKLPSKLQSKPIDINPIKT